MANDPRVQPEIARGSFIRKAVSSGIVLSATALPSRRAAAQNTSAKYTITLGTTSRPPNPAEVAIDNWADLVMQRSRGAVAVHVVHNGQLGSEQQVVASTQKNAIQGGACSNANFDSFTPAMEALELPYLVRTSAAYFRVFDGPIGREMKARLEKDVGVKVIMLLDAGGFRSIMTRGKQVRLPADTSGMKFRIAGTPIELATFKNIGVAPVFVSFSETFSMLQQGTLDGVVLQPSFMYSGRLHEVAKYVCDIHYVMYTFVCYMGADFFNSLPHDIQTLLLDTGLQVQNHEREVSAAAVDYATKQMIKSGVQWHSPTSGELTEWMNATRGVWQQFEPKIGGNVIQAIEKA